MHVIQRGIASALLLSSTTALALDYQFDDLNITINNRFTSGISMRMQNPSNDLIGKTNVPGQQNLCNADSCISLTGNPEPNQRLVNAAGAFSGVNADNGDLNYQRYDIVNASNRLSSDMTVKYGNILTRVRGIFFYDPINNGFDEHHNDTRFQPASTPRTRKVENLIGKGIDLYDAYAQYEFKWSERNAAISVGYQTVRWGESTLIARNAIAEINSPSSIMLHTPGFEINEVFRPVPSIVLSTDLLDGISGEFFYQLKWQKIQADPAGSFFGDQDLLDGTFAAISLGQFGEDPNKRQRANGPIALISSTSATTYLDAPHDAKDMGQFGVRINYNAEWLNDGTELSFYFLNYHSRYPYASATATDASCTRGPAAQAAGGANTLTAFIDCQGFNGSLLGRENEHNPEREPLPVDTFRAYLEYPENIQMYGLSFNTNALGFSFAGEYSFRPNLPLQVSLTDVIFTGLQPAFPGNDFAVDPTGLNALAAGLSGLGIQNVPGLGNLGQLAGARFPSADTAVPSFLRRYRGLGPIQAHQVIPGYERFAVGQFDLTAIKAFSTNPFGADQIIWINEVGFTQILGMPDKSELQIEAGGPNRTHASIGQDEKGPNDYATLNPHRQTSGFADRFSWGVRSIIKGEYSDVVFGWNFKPTIILQWDIGGIAPFPIQNFVEGRQQADIGTDINITQAFSARVNYEIFTGGGRENTYKDRDNMSLSFAYAF
jgi:hypothetical protein